MDEATAAQRAFQRISGGRPDAQSPALRSAIQLSITDALSVLAQRTYESPRRAVLEKAYSPTLTSGAVSLASGFTDLWFPSLRTARMIYDPSGTAVRIEYYDNPRDLELPHITGLYRASVIGNSLIVVDETANAPSNATLDIRASYVPAITALPSDGSLDNDLIDILVELALRVHSGTSEPAAQEVA